MEEGGIARELGFDTLIPGHGILELELGSRGPDAGVTSLFPAEQPVSFGFCPPGHSLLPSPCFGPIFQENQLGRWPMEVKFQMMFLRGRGMPLITLSFPLLAFCIQGGTHSCLEAESWPLPICNMSLCV